MNLEEENNKMKMIIEKNKKEYGYSLEDKETTIAELRKELSENFRENTTLMLDNKNIYNNNMLTGPANAAGNINSLLI